MQQCQLLVLKDLFVNLCNLNEDQTLFEDKCVHKFFLATNRTTEFHRFIV